LVFDLVIVRVRVKLIRFDLVVVVVIVTTRSLVGTTGKLVSSACYDKQQVSVYLQPFSC